MVSNRSDFTDSIWDYSEEVKVPSYETGHKKLRFSGVWARCPDLTHTVKHYLWSRRKGEGSHRRCSWQTLRSALGRIRHCAIWLEVHGFTRWDQLTLEDWRQCYVDAIIGKKFRYVLACEIGTMGEMMLPMGPIKEPLAGIALKYKDTSRRTRAIQLDGLRQFARIMASYEPKLDALMQYYRDWEKDHLRRWDGSLLGIRIYHDLMREFRFARYSAACILMLSCGMRLSELLSLKSGCLYYDQKYKDWFVRGTVYKFHGNGMAASWACGQMGKRAVEFLERLWTAGGLFSTWKGYPVSSCHIAHNFRQFVVRFNIVEDDKPMHLHAHRFRKSFVQEVFKTGTVGLLPLMDQMKHRNAVMTDRYVDNCTIIHDHLERELNCPLGEFQSNLAKALKL